MDKLASNISSGVDTAISTPQLSAQTQPIPAPPATQTPAPIYQPPIMSSGGVSGSSDNFLRNINWVDVGILMLGTAALYWTIYYYRIKIRTHRRELVEVGNKIEMMDAKVNAIQKAQQEQNQNQNQNRRAKRPVML